MPAQPAAPEGAKTSRYATGFVLVTVLLDMIAFGIVIPVMPKLITDVGQVSFADAARIGGWMAAVYSITQFLFGPLMGNLSDRFGRRPLLLLAVFGLAADFLLQALAPTLGWLFLGRLLAGLCGASWVIANAYIADVTPPEGRAKAFGIMGAAFGLGFVIGPAIGGILGTYGPRVPFYVAAGVGLVNFAYGWFVLPESLPLANRRAFDWRRANPFGAFRVFQSYHGVLPMCVVLASFFFFTSVYPAIWPFWGMANFGWSEAMVGLSLAIFGVIMAGFQGGLSGPAVKHFGEYRVVLIGIVAATIAAFGYGMAGTLWVVVVLMFVHGPEGFIHPMLTALMSQRVPEDAQGELQGGISAITNIAMLLGIVFYAQIFGYFMSPGAPFQSPNVAYYVAGAGLMVTLALFLWLVGHDGAKAAQGRRRTKPDAGTLHRKLYAARAHPRSGNRGGAGGAAPRAAAPLQHRTGRGGRNRAAGRGIRRLHRGEILPCRGLRGLCHGHGAAGLAGGAGRSGADQRLHAGPGARLDCLGGRAACFY